MTADAHNRAPGEETGHQRLTVERLDRWRALGYGMFIHFGLATFETAEGGRAPSPDRFAPCDLDVDQWVRTARDAGMRYAILTARHILDGGFCLWPTETHGHSVAKAAVKTDIVEAFVAACDRRGVRPALYLGGDTVSAPGGLVRNPVSDAFFYVTRAYTDILLAQIEELLTRYGPIEEVWIDGPQKHGVAGRAEIRDRVESLQPGAVVAMNMGFRTSGKGVEVKPNAWPTDVRVIELSVPPVWGTGQEAHAPWRRLPWDPDGRPVEEPLPYYMPVECCLLGNTGPQGWHWGPEARARTPLEMLGARLLCRARDANCVLNIPPDRSGRIPDAYVRMLAAVREQWETLGLA